MDSLETAIRRLIKEKYGSIPKFADVIDVPPTSIYGALDRGMGNTRTELSDKIYRELNIDWETANISDFRGLKLKSQTTDSQIDIPLYGKIAAGTAIEMEEIKEYRPVPIDVHEKYPDAFLLEVEGESMNRILPNGCYALVDPCVDVEHDGKPYAICVNGDDATIKRVRRLNNGFELVPDSTDPTFKPAVYDFNDDGADPVTVIGEVVYYVLPCDWGF